ncbi:3-phosphoshikimate 1-carboxyvinyltransferase [Propioniferax innocua]|uniref:3-phosphoshikimate 1-carboxyvinyltransferase n=2 Tax=Propioniferax innocua TaxID=1753 RepID=A0A542ZB87_9ACTN|nr:3-phosphoshikimate 1-carboxyvinyltransferase [Propioniferax innocua]TQL57613.1 3-phosphoshikimate 1-carboxyvinyltransferase [Propioniferax innocua]
MPDEALSLPRRAADEGPWPAPIATEPVHATIVVPGSKSETNRALVLAALSDGPSRISGGLEARDTRLMREGLRTLGVTIDDSTDDWLVTPPDGGFRGGGTIDCGLAGTVMRFLPPIAALADGPTHFVGDPEAEKRPMGPLLDALYDMGAEVSTDTDSLPFTVHGRPDLPGGPIRIDASGSSQFVSGLLLMGARCARGLDVEHIGETLPSRPHIDMTVAMLNEHGIRAFDEGGTRWCIEPSRIVALDSVIEPDLTNAAVFLAAAVMTVGSVTVPGWPFETNQPGDRIRQILTDFGAEVRLDSDGLHVTGTMHPRGVDLDLSDASELTPVVAALAAIAHQSSTIRGVGHIRGHETDRLAALEAELNELGSATHQTEDGLSIAPRMLHGGDWHTYADHRMAHAGALIGLIVDDVTLDDVTCTSKTLPDFPGMWRMMLEQSAVWSEQNVNGEA